MNFRGTWRQISILVAWVAVVAGFVTGVVPSWIGYSLAIALLAIMIVVIPCVNGWFERRLKKHVTAEIEQLGGESINIKMFEAHWGVHFRMRGEKHYLKFEHADRGKGIVHWIGKSPRDLIGPAS